MHDVVVRREDWFSRSRSPGFAFTHDGDQIVGMIQSESMTNFVQRDTEPRPTIFALAPVDVGVHQREATSTTKSRRCIWRHHGFLGTQVTCNDLNPAAGRFLNDHSSLLGPDLKDLTGSLLLILCNRIVQSVALRVLSVIIGKVKLDYTYRTWHSRSCPA